MFVTESVFSQVFALEEVNVRKAINRYGTLPKGARIGAYLDSLKQDPLSGGGEAPADFLDDDNGEGASLRKSSLPQQRTKNKQVRVFQCAIAIYNAIHPR